MTQQQKQEQEEGEEEKLKIKANLRTAEGIFNYWYYGNVEGLSLHLAIDDPQIYIYRGEKPDELHEFRYEPSPICKHHKFNCPECGFIWPGCVTCRENAAKMEENILLRVRIRLENRFIPVQVITVWSTLPKDEIRKYALENGEIPQEGEFIFKPYNYQRKVSVVYYAPPMTPEERKKFEEEDKEFLESYKKKCGKIAIPHADCIMATDFS